MSDIDLSAAKKITITRNDDGQTFTLEADFDLIEDDPPESFEEALHWSPTRHYFFPHTTISGRIIVLPNEEGK